MEVNELFKNIAIKGNSNTENCVISGICCDTDKLKPGDAYICLKGKNIDGHTLAKTAIDKGAKLIIAEKYLDLDVPQVVLENTRIAMGMLAANFYHNPADKLKIIGVTGTNGKTTTTYMLKSILEAAGKRVGVIGTLGCAVGDKIVKTSLTTPDPIEMHEIFATFADMSVEYVAMEVSAHAIALNKMSGITCDVGILTNVTQDHLDYFQTFENYAKTKASFITNAFCKAGVVNIDDEVGRKIVLNAQNNTNTDFKIASYGLFNPSDVFATKIKYSINGTSCFFNILDDLKVINTRLIGEFNVYNALAAATACACLGISSESIKVGLDCMAFVPGRFNVLNLANGAAVVIDYAHTPDGLEKILSSVRKVSNGKIYSVFGCGGNRDKLKRPIMGEISAELADFTVITSDNPRLEKPEDIIKDVEVGVKQKTLQYTCIADRKKAINYVLGKLNRCDVAVLAGKGAEDYIDVGGVKVPYNDEETVRAEYLKLNKEAYKC